MVRRTAEIVADFDALNAADFDFKKAGANGWETLDRLCDEAFFAKDPEPCVLAMFRVMERLDEVELGTPGPLVHTLERWRGIYESFLADSICRKPTQLSVWMINRILNAKPSDSEKWSKLLHVAANHPAASEAARLEAKRFLAYQSGS